MLPAGVSREWRMRHLSEEAGKVEEETQGKPDDDFEKGNVDR